VIIREGTGPSRMMVTLPLLGSNSWAGKVIVANHLPGVDGYALLKRWAAAGVCCIDLFPPTATFGGWCWWVVWSAVLSWSGFREVEFAVRASERKGRVVEEHSSRAGRGLFQQALGGGAPWGACSGERCSMRQALRADLFVDC
jgi:hypothetical protein